MNAAMPKRAEAARGAIRRIPAAIFPISLGLSGLGAAWVKTAPLASVPAPPGFVALYAGLAVLLAGVALYAYRLFHDWASVKADFGDTTIANLFAPACMAAMVQGGWAANPLPGHEWLWAAGCAGHVTLAITFIGRWIVEAHGSDRLNPTWFLPMAGLLVAPFTNPGLAPAELGWIILGAGAVLWLSLTALILRRVVFEPALPPRLRPTLFILCAPGALTALGLMALAPGLPANAAGSPAHIGLLFFLAFAARPRFFAETGISMTWWSTTFPVATLGSAYAGMAILTGSAIYMTLAVGLVSAAGLFSAGALLATLQAARRALTSSEEA